MAAACHDCVQVTSQVGRGGIRMLTAFWESISDGDLLRFICIIRLDMYS